MFISSSLQTKRGIYWTKLLDHHLEERVYKALRTQDTFVLYISSAWVDILTRKIDIFPQMGTLHFIPQNYNFLTKVFHEK